MKERGDGSLNQTENRRISRREVPLQSILSALKRHIVMICAVSILFACGAWGYTKYFITPRYTTKASLCVFAGQRENDSITYNELTSDAAIAKTYSILLTSQPVLSAVSKALNGEISADAIGGMLSIELNSQMIYVRVTGTDPARIVRVANAVLDVAPSTIKTLFRAGEMVAVDRPKTPSAPSSPNVKTNVMSGFAVGLLFSCAVIATITLLDTTIWREEDLERAFHIPVLGKVPNMQPKSYSGIRQSKRRSL